MVRFCSLPTINSLGAIPEANETYNVVGNINEWGLSIGETTYGGLEELNQGQDAALIDYGSLIWITLQRAKTAREAIAVAADLMAKCEFTVPPSPPPPP